MLHAHKPLESVFPGQKRSFRSTEPDRDFVCVKHKRGSRCPALAAAYTDSP